MSNDDRTYVGPDGHWRIALPPKVATAIHRQSDALTSKLRRTIAKEQAEARKAAGWRPAFLKKAAGE